MCSRFVHIHVERLWKRQNYLYMYHACFNALLVCFNLYNVRVIYLKVSNVCACTRFVCVQGFCLNMNNISLCERFLSVHKMC